MNVLFRFLQGCSTGAQARASIDRSSSSRATQQHRIYMVKVKSLLFSLFMFDRVHANKKIR